MTADKRFTITQEYTGRPTLQYVVRWCGQFMVSRDTYYYAELYMLAAIARRDNMLQNHA